MKLDIDVPYLVEERNVVLIPTNGAYDHLLPPEAKLIGIKGTTFYAVDNTPEFNSLLYAAGVPVLAPIYFSEYDWAGIKVYAAQVQMAALLSSRRRCFNLSALGAGKTIGSLLAIDWLIQEGVIQRALIVAPLSTLWTVWEQEIEANFYRLIPAVLHGTKQKRLKLLNDSFWNVAIINHDGPATIQQELLYRNFQCIVIDEIASFRDARTRRWRIMKTIVDKAEYAAGLTGSPTPNYPSDAYGIAKLMVPHRVPKSFLKFRQTVELEVMPGNWKPRKGSADVVAKVLQPAVRFLRSEISELKDVHLLPPQRVLMSDRQQDALTKLKRDAIIQYPEGVVNAVNAATLLGKLLQICAGAVYTTGRDVVDLEAEQRLDTVKTTIEASEGKVIIIAPYIHVAKIISHSLGNKYPHFMVMGEISPRQRSEIFKAFQDKRDPVRVIIAHPRVLAHGLNLTAANTILWYAPIFSREIYEQVNGRIIRLGQELEQYIRHLSSGSEEDAAYRVLERKGTMQEAVLQAFNLQMLGGITETLCETTELVH